jgi:integrase
LTESGPDTDTRLQEATDVAWITKRSTGKGAVRYLVGWREVGTNKRVHESFHRRADAEARKREIEHLLDTRQYTPKAEREQALGEVIVQMLDTDRSLGKIGKSSHYLYTMTYKKHIAPVLGHRPIGAITTTELERFFAGLTASKKVIHQLLSKAFGRAVSKGILTRSPLGEGRDKAIPKPRTPRADMEGRLLTPSQIDELADAADPRYRVAILVGGFAGLRAGEIGGLRLIDVDLDNRKLKVRQGVKSEGGVRVVGELKTDSSRRKITIPRWLCDEITKHIESFEPAEDGRIFTTNGHKGLMSSMDLNRVMKAAAEKIGMTPAPSPHVLRHSCASILIRNKANPKQVQRFLGHATISITMDTYVDLWPDDLDELANSLEGLRSEIESGAPVLALGAG